MKERNRKSYEDKTPKLERIMRRIIIVLAISEVAYGLFRLHELGWF